MGTRSLTIIKDQTGNDIAVIYRQFDGYPTGLGADLKEILKGASIVNGYAEEPPNTHNGMSCLAATLVKALKDGIGNVYLYPAGTRDCGEEYRYILTPGQPIGESSAFKTRQGVNLLCQSGYGSEWETVFDGPVDNFEPEEES